MALGDGVIARFLFQMWEAIAARTSAGAVSPHGASPCSLASMKHGGWVLRVGIPRERARAGKPVQALCSTPGCPAGRGYWKETWSLGVQLLVEFLSRRQEALGLIPSTDEPGLEGHVWNSSTRGCRQEIPKFQLYSEF